MSQLSDTSLVEYTIFQPSVLIVIDTPPDVPLDAAEIGMLSGYEALARETVAAMDTVAETGYEGSATRYF